MRLFCLVGRKLVGRVYADLSCALRKAVQLFKEDTYLLDLDCPTLSVRDRVGCEVVIAPLRKSVGILVAHVAILGLLLAGCKHVSELQVQQHQEAVSAATTETHEVKSEGPEHIVMTVEEYEQLCPGEQIKPVAPSAQPQATPNLQQCFCTLDFPPSRCNCTPLIRRTVTVTDRGPSLDDLHQLSTLQSKVNTALAVHEEKKSGPAGLLGLLGGLWPVVLIGGAILAGVVAFKLKPPWLSFLFKLLGRAP